MNELTRPAAKGGIAQPAFQSGQGACINDLSNEIITLIAKSIRQPFTNLFNYSTSYASCNTTLLNFILCSRDLKRLVEPVLYEEFNEEYRTSAEPRYPDIARFLFRLMARPDLAAKVQRISVQGQVSDYGANGELSTGLDVSMVKNEDWTLVGDAMRALTTEEESKQKSLGEMKSGKWEAFFVVMLALLPNLQEIVALSWGHYYDEFNLLDEFLVNSAHGQKTDPTGLTVRFALRCLEKVTLIYHDTEGCMGPEVMFQWMALPSVHSIKATAISADSEDDEDEDFDVDDKSELPDWVSRDKFPNIKSLTLENSNLNAIDIAGILRSLSNIEYLEYCHGGATVSHAEFHAARMVYGISVAKNTLRHLSLFDYDYNSDESILGETNGISLRDFISLKTLHTYPAALLGSGDLDPVEMIMRLPPNLENLIIDEGKHDLMSVAITHLLENITSFPSLKSINLHWRLVTYPDDPSPRLAESIPGFERSHAIHLLDLCKKFGIKMVLKNCRPPYKLFHDWYDKTKVSSSGRVEELFRTQYVAYPYTEWEEMCKEFEVNPDTGRRWDSRYPLSGVVWHYAP